MSDVADNGLPEGNDPMSPPAGAQEPSIPKHRFDEVANALRTEREQNALLKNLINQQAGQQAPQQRGVNFEALGVDPQTGQAFMQLAQEALRPEIERLQMQNGHLANRNEELEFLTMYGHEKKAYLPQIRAKVKEYAQRYGGHLPVEAAYTMILGEASTRAARQPVTRQQPQGQQPLAPQPQQQFQQQQAPQQQPAPEQNYGGYPDPAMTRQAPSPSGGVAPRGNRALHELSVEEMEASLDEQLRSTGQTNF